jgi:methionine sulfoxide reductase heme-binding subunit
MGVINLALVDPSRYLFWITSRAAGIAALVLASATVGVGLAMATGWLKRIGSDRRSIHEILSLSVIVAIAVHGLSLLGDSYLHPSLLDIAVPGFLSYRTLATAVGIIAGWGLVFLGLSYYARRWIGQNRWRLIHRFTALMWVLGLIHAFTAGSDAGETWFIALIAITAAPAALLLLARWMQYLGSASPGSAAAMPERGL